MWRSISYWLGDQPDMACLRPHLDQHRPSVGRFRPEVARVSQSLGQVRPIWGRVWPKLSESGKLGPILVKVRLVSPKRCKLRPGWGRVRPSVGQASAKHRPRSATELTEIDQAWTRCSRNSGRVRPQVGNQNRAGRIAMRCTPVPPTWRARTFAVRKIRDVHMSGSSIIPEITQISDFHEAMRFPVACLAPTSPSRDVFQKCAFLVALRPNLGLLTLRPLLGSAMREPLQRPSESPQGRRSRLCESRRVARA